MDIRKVKKLIELLEESGIAEIEIHEGEESVRISRGSSVAPAPQTYISAPAAVPQPVAAASESIKSHLNSEESKTVGDYSDEGHVINAPMVGIFYNSPSPEEPAYVEKGQDIKVGDTLCIIEAHESYRSRC